MKRERTTKSDDWDSSNFRQESIRKTDITKITEKGGLVDSEGVEKLVQLMVPDRNEKILDLVCRSMLAGVVAATDQFDCLSRFVHLRGLPVLDEWLQDIHRGKIGDGSGPKDSDKSVEEFLFVLLRALAKLPVNLQALQMCNIGKSVNHLRTHKNLEIQKKARGLVDTWKKRVEAEINTSDAKSGSSQGVPWSARPCPPEVAQGGNRHSVASSDVLIKSSVTQLSSSKTAPVKLAQGESASRSTFASASPGSMKSVLSSASANTNSKDGLPRGATVGGASDLPVATAKDEKSSSSSPSHNNSQSNGKGGARGSTAGSISLNKISGGSSRHRKLSNGFTGSTVPGGQRETRSTRSSLHKTSASEKLSESGLTCEKELDGPVVEGISHNLIVKIPNRGRSPAQSVSGGSFDAPSIMNSRASSPVLSEKHNQLDHSMKEKSDSYRVNVTPDFNSESWQSNDFKDLLTGSDEAGGSPAAAATDEECCKISGNNNNLLEVSQDASLSSGYEYKSGNLQDASFSSINALIDSCVKYSGANVPVSVADDGGMNLLASVAAGEISKSDLVAPTGSPQINTTLVEQSCPGNGAEVKSPEVVIQDQALSNGRVGDEHKKQDTISCDLGANIRNNESAPLTTEGKVDGDQNRHINSTCMYVQKIADICLEGKGKLIVKPVSASLTAFPVSTIDKASDSEAEKTFKKRVIGGVRVHENYDEKHNVNGSSLFEDNVNGVSSEDVEMEAAEKSSSHPYSEFDVKGKHCMIEGLSSGGKIAQNSPAIMLQPESFKGTDEDMLHPSGSGIGTAPENLGEHKDGKDNGNHVCKSQDQSKECDSNGLVKPQNEVLGGLCSDVSDHNAKYVEENSEAKEVHEQQILHAAFPSFPSQETEQCLDFKGSKLTGMGAEEAEECTCTTADSSSVPAAGVSDIDAKVEFDLNEGLNADDGKCGELNGMMAPGCSDTVQLISPVVFPASSLSGSIPALITVAAAAKGPFVRPEDLLKRKVELGWRGSAATSAFRPAEPRKALEMPPGTRSNIVPNVTAAKPSRPLLDIDLNIPGEKILEDIAFVACSLKTDTVSIPSNNHESAHHRVLASAPIRCSGGLDLDLNELDEASDVGKCSTSNSLNLDMSLVPVKLLSGSPPNSKVNVYRDFDLNNGPAVDEVSAEPSLFIQNTRSSVPSQHPVSGLRMSNTEIGNFSSWIPSTGNTYSAITTSPIMHDKGDQPFSIVATSGPQRMLGPSTGGNPFGSDVYRGSVLSSSPAVAFPPAPTPFQYPVFPFGSSFPLPSSSFSGGSATYVDSTSGGRLCFPTVNSQFIRPSSTISSHYPRPYVVSLAENSNDSSAESTKGWGMQGLDLNTGPGGPDVEGRDEFVLAPRQFSLARSQSLVEEQARMFQVAGLLKRKEPEGGWDGYKQSSWQ